LKSLLKPSPKGEGWMRGNQSVLDFILLTPALSSRRGSDTELQLVVFNYKKVV